MDSNLLTSQENIFMNKSNMKTNRSTNKYDRKDTLKESITIDREKEVN